MTEPQHPEDDKPSKFIGTWKEPALFWGGVAVVGAVIWWAIDRYGLSSSINGDTVVTWAIIVLGAGSVVVTAAKVWMKPDGDLVPHVMCPHCQHKGKVYRDLTIEKGGIDGTKAAGAVVTGGTSLWFTGLSQKHDVANMTCKNCGSVWMVRR